MAGAAVTGWRGIRREREANVLKVGVKALGEHRRQNVMRGGQSLRRARRPDRRHPVLHVHPQPTGKLGQGLLQFLRTGRLGQHRQRPDVNVVEVAAGELRYHPRRHRRDERQPLDTLHKSVEEAGRVALGAVGQAAKILQCNGGSFADRTPPDTGRVRLRQFQFHVTAKLHDPRRTGGPVDRLPPLRFRHRFPKIGIESVAEEAPAEIVALAEERQAARKTKDFARSDQIRDELAAQGWVIEDTPKGPRVKRA